MNGSKRRANASSSTALPSRPLNRFAMTGMTPTAVRLSGKRDSCDSLSPRIRVGWPPGRASTYCAVSRALLPRWHSFLPW